jgi:hypothetical protein
MFAYVIVLPRSANRNDSSAMALISLKTSSVGGVARRREVYLNIASATSS